MPVSVHKENNLEVAGRVGDTPIQCVLVPSVDAQSCRSVGIPSIELDEPRAATCLRSPFLRGCLICTETIGGYRVSLRKNGLYGQASFRVLRNPSRVDAKRGNHFLQAELTNPAMEAGLVLVSRPLVQKR